MSHKLSYTRMNSNELSHRYMTCRFINFAERLKQTKKKLFILSSTLERTMIFLQLVTKTKETFFIVL